MIDLLICYLVLVPFLTADIQLHSGDHEAGETQVHLFSMPLSGLRDKGETRRGCLLKLCPIKHLLSQSKQSMLGQTHFVTVYIVVTYQHFR